MRPLLLLILLFHCACAQTRKNATPSYTGLKLKPLPASSISGNPATQAEISNARWPGTLTHYQLGRLLSKDRRMMHEPHRAYRMSESPLWKLDSSAGERRTESAPWFHSSEVSAELTRQKGITAELLAAKAELEALSQKALHTLEALRAGQPPGKTPTPTDNSAPAATSSTEVVP